MKTENFFWLLLLVCLCSITACKKFIQIDPPETKAESSRVFSTDQSATSAGVGLYVQLVASGNSFCNGALTLYPGLSADELTNVNSSTVYDPFKTNSLLASLDALSGTFWMGPYRNIYQANAVLEGVTASSSLSAVVTEQLTGEMLFIRAFHYFNLVNLYGGVPLITKTDYEANAQSGRATVDEIYGQIIADLIRAKEALTQAKATSPNTRVSKDAVTALLAKVYLYRGQWSEAERMATEVINSGKYSLEPLGTVFGNTSKETIFQIAKQNGNVYEGSLFIPSSTTVRPAFAITDSLLNAFQNGDGRKAAWIKSNTVAGTVFSYPCKYKVRTSTPISEFYIVQRLAEQYLIRAEALANQDLIAAAIDDIDRIRNRAGVPHVKTTNPNISKTELLDAILKERQTELFAEWGNRWFDLKRLGKADGILASFKAPTWQSTDQLYPIPLFQIQDNPFLIQNPGYTN